MVWRQPGRLDHLHAGIPSVAVRWVRLCFRTQSLPHFAKADCLALLLAAFGDLYIAYHTDRRLETSRRRFTGMDDHAVAPLQSRCTILFAILDRSIASIVARPIQCMSRAVSALLPVQRWVHAGAAELSVRDRADAFVNRTIDVLVYCLC